LFSLKVDGVYWWDIVRHDVFHLIYKTISDIPVAPGRRIAIDLGGRLRRIVGSIVLNVRVFYGGGGALFFRCARNMRDNSYVDIISDSLIDLCRNDSFVIDTYPYRYHIPSAIFKYADCKYTDATLGNIREIIKNKLGVDMDLREYISSRVATYKRERNYYLYLIKKISPKCVVVVQNGIQKSLFAAAQELGVPSIELQHGLINYIHPAYSYSRKINYEHIRYFPDYLLTISDFWLKDCFYPVKNIVNVGCDSLYCVPQRITDRSCLVATANVYDGVLRPMLKKISGFLKDWKFIYKLHPNQYHEFSDVVEDLKPFRNVSVIANQKSIRDCLGEVSTVVAIQSTSVYESLQAGKLVVILKEYDYNAHQDVFLNSNVRLVNDAAEMMETLGNLIPGNLKESTTIFFDKFKRQVVVDLFERLGLKTS